MANDTAGKSAPRSNVEVDVVCFGTLNRCYVLVVDEIPVHNGGARINQVAEVMGDDAAIVAQLVREWGVPAGLICNALGDDEAGRAISRRIRELDVAADIRVSTKISTPLEVAAADPAGGRTYYWERRPEVLETLDTADLSMLRGARLLYVDWYDGDCIIRPMKQAADQGLSVFLNIESRFEDGELIEKTAPYATICQASMDEPGGRAGAAPERVARNLLDAGFDTVAVTVGDCGSVVADSSEVLSIRAPKLDVVDGYGAGAVFSAAFIYGRLKGWSLSECGRFATAAGSLKCEVAGLLAPPVQTAKQLASDLPARQM